MRYSFISFSLLLLSTYAAAEDCEFSRTVDIELDASQVTLADVKTSAGDEQIVGVDNSTQAHFTATLCASSAELLAQTHASAVIDDATLVVRSNKPDDENGSFWQRRYAYVNLTLNLPSYIKLTHQDSSGSVTISGVKGGLNLTDSSGDLELQNTGGLITLKDSSGEIRVAQHNGDVNVESDSSGDIWITDVMGSVRIYNDSSGGIAIHTVTDDVWIGHDSSGSIDVSDVGGSFTLKHDGSGEVSYERVAGVVAIPAHKREG